MKPWTRWLLYPALLPTDIVGWLLVCVLRLLFGKALGWEDGVLIVDLDPNSWFATTLFKNWGGATIGHAIIVHSVSAEARKRILTHERVHVTQHETNALAGLVLALPTCVMLDFPRLAGLVLPLAGFVWTMTPWLVYVAGYITGACYGLNAYLGNPAEEAARDHTQVVDSTSDS